MAELFEKKNVNFSAITTALIYGGGYFFIPSFKEMTGVNAMIIGYIFLVILFMLQNKNK